jgi:hypothetical protein
LAALIVSEPKFVSGSEIALPAVALRASTMINKHRDQHKNLTHFRVSGTTINSLPKRMTGLLMLISTTLSQSRRCRSVLQPRACLLDDNTMSFLEKHFERNDAA